MATKRYEDAALPKIFDAMEMELSDGQTVQQPGAIE